MDDRLKLAFIKRHVAFPRWAKMSGLLGMLCITTQIPTEIKPSPELKNAKKCNSNQQQTIMQCETTTNK